MNNQHYPKVFYPELYILEGGYFEFFSQCPVSLGAGFTRHRSNKLIVEFTGQM